VSQQASAAAFEIVVNGETHRVPAGSTVETLLVQLAMAGKRVAVARNRAVVPRSRYGVEALGAGDRVEILEAVGGG
jgi:sulfur carrier protein